jgi:hypothetical protein
MFRVVKEREHRLAFSCETACRCLCSGVCWYGGIAQGDALFGPVLGFRCLACLRSLRNMGIAAWRGNLPRAAFLRFVSFLPLGTWLSLSRLYRSTCASLCRSVGTLNCAGG